MLITKVVFRVDASSSMGMGHLLRCLALAQALDQHPAVKAIIFVMLAASKPFAKSRTDWVGDIVILPADLPQQAEPQWLSDFCQRQQVDVLALDGYQFDADYRQALSSIPSVFVLFDDMNNSGDLYCDLVINSASNADALEYQSTAPQASLCLGDKYRILRREFVQKDYCLPWAERDGLVVVMGGSDPFNVSLQILQTLEQHKFSHQIKLATGGAYAHHAELGAFLTQTNLQVEHLQNCQQMAQLFGEAKLVISAAGGSQFELLACQSPALLVIVAANQRNATQAAAKQGWCQAIDYCAKPDIAELAQRTLQLWQQDLLLEQMFQTAGQYADTAGAERVVTEILKRVETNHA
ncbi:UDP-2,4-diacetamido-2,4,6-trideoxy-beta-L-altropyranose hydrolase [Paraglaciecola hydrolytica]|uniref:Glycosyl transferase family 28 C-terminal domain-containing protein n=1 Tax=Paraglaciecola hydrolytica TaxID=1799789 RepID=A0A148KNM5_9ALTE|nr:UDP-2,4-diacetamido-2,4,6-trideoxy-beta-L-altropyranose hydrolase [Paraglaciecola hydrolytica]KXI27907.1 hypothetical protein AX660_20585 [Paraglaciecola hydrolytica]